jgi:lysophospholipase L1-like esterase
MKTLRILAALALSASLAHASDFFVRDGDRVVFLGDSITEQRLYTTYLEAYVLTRHPDWKLTFRNAGWSGDTAWLRQRAHPNEGQLFAAKDEEQQAMIRKSVGDGLARDVLPLRPTVVTIKFGMNDHAYQAFRPDIFKAYAASQAELVQVLKTNGARVALLTPQPIEERRADPDQDIRNLSLRQFSDGLREVAQTNGALFVDQFSPYLALMMSQRATNAQAHIGGGDAVHPGPAGQTLMAWAILKGLGATSLVSSAEIKCGWWNRARHQQNCRVTNIKRADGVLSFDRLDGALPLPFDPRAEAALQIAPVVDDLDVYALKVSGLKAGRYAVSVDGVAAGEVSQAELAQGWNMAHLKTPMAEQAQTVLQLVFKKNNVYFNRWRNVQLNPARQAELPALDQEIAALEAQIDEARIPKLHHFELKPVPAAGA